MLTNCRPLSVSTEAVIRYDTTQMSKNIDTTCGTVDCNDGIAPVGFVYPPFMKTMKWFAVVILSAGPESHCEEFQGPSGLEKFQVALPLQATSIYSMFTAVNRMLCT